MQKFYVKDCPPDTTIFDWLRSQTDFDSAKKDIIANKHFDTVISIPHTLNINSLKADVLDTIDDYGIKGWQTSKGDSNAYGGLSMVYNPDLTETVDPNQSTLGTSVNEPGEFFYGSSNKFKSKRNTYFDSYGFRCLAPCIENSVLKTFMSGFALSPTRSRIAVLDGNYHQSVGEEFLWHKDEEVFENLRINIPITTNDYYMFQLEKQDPIHLDVGNCYTWDTHLAHRVYMTTTTKQKRIHLVLGFSPWFDYCKDDDSFSVNEFFGKMHPIDIILNGHAHKDLGNG